MRIKPLISLAFFVGISLLAGLLGSLATAGNVEGWYQTLMQPSWTPPDWVFAPVWTTLYVLMGVGAYLVSRSRKLGRYLALWLFLAHLLVNAFWSIAFFGMHEILLALIVIALLWMLIVLLIILFSKHSRVAAYLLLPYLAWVTYAATLNAGFLFLN